MKLQLLFLPALFLAVILDLTLPWKISLSALVVAAFLLSTVPFALRAIRKDPVVGILSPILLAARSCAQMLGVAAGMIYAARNSSRREAFGLR
jgi:Asp/Glu/hydantoin racemase